MGRLNGAGGSVAMLCRRHRTVIDAHSHPPNLVLVPDAKLSQAIVISYYLPDRELAVLVESVELPV